MHQSSDINDYDSMIDPTNKQVQPFASFVAEITNPHGGRKLCGAEFELYRHNLRLGAVLPDGAPCNIKHPSTGYTLSNAIEMAISSAMSKGCGSNTPIPSSLEEVRHYIRELQLSKPYLDVTCETALEVLDVAIDGKSFNPARWSQYAHDGFFINTPRV